MITEAISGLRNAIVTRVGVKLPVGKPAAPVSLGTGSGTPAVILPPTVAAPPSATQAVDQQLASSNQIMENTVTGAGIGAGNNSLPITVKVKTPSAYLWLAALGIALILAVLVDMEKL
jgi:hypothetical protein